MLRRLVFLLFWRDGFVSQYSTWRLGCAAGPVHEAAEKVVQLLIVVFLGDVGSRHLFFLDGVFVVRRIIGVAIL